MNARHELIPLTDRASWERAVGTLEHAHGHTWEHVAAFAAEQARVTYLYVLRDDGDAPLVVCPLALRGEADAADAYTPYGFSGFAARDDRRAFAEEYDRFATERGWVATYALQYPEHRHDLGFPDRTVRAQGEAYLVDLAVPDEELLAVMSSRRRAGLRRWDREHHELTDDHERVVAHFVARADSFFGERGASSTYRFSTWTWRALLAASSTIAIGLVEGDRVVAAVLFGIVGSRAEYLFGMSSHGHEASVTPLIWEGMKAARDRGATRMNLGGGVQPGDGVAEAKRRFGADVRPIESVRLVHRLDRYRALNRRAGTDPDPLAGYFPPYHR